MYISAIRLFLGKRSASQPIYQVPLEGPFSLRVAPQNCHVALGQRMARTRSVTLYYEALSRTVFLSSA